MCSHDGMVRNAGLVVSFVSDGVKDCGSGRQTGWHWSALHASRCRDTPATWTCDMDGWLRRLRRPSALGALGALGAHWVHTGCAACDGCGGIAYRGNSPIEAGELFWTAVLP